MRNRYIFVHRPGAESCLEMFLIPTLVPCALLCEADRDANQPVGEYKTTKDLTAQNARVRMLLARRASWRRKLP